MTCVKKFVRVTVCTFFVSIARESAAADASLVAG
jgi:hypothetical protein